MNLDAVGIFGLDFQLYLNPAHHTVARDEQTYAGYPGGDGGDGGGAPHMPVAAAFEA